MAAFGAYKDMLHDFQALHCFVFESSGRYDDKFPLSFEGTIKGTF